MINTDLIPVVLPMAGVLALDEVCVQRKTTAVRLLAGLGLRIALTGAGGVGGPDDGAARVDEDEMIVVLAAVHALRMLTGTQVLALWRALDGQGLMRPWLAGVDGRHGPVVEAHCAVVAYLGDLALGRDLVNVGKQLGDRERCAMLRDAGVSGAEWALLRFEHGLPENAGVLREEKAALGIRDSAFVAGGDGGKRAGCGSSTNGECPMPNAATGGGA